jgi:hypothetical protein
MNELPQDKAPTDGPPLHPDGDTLLNLMLGLLPEAEEQHLFAHLAACPQCERGFQELCACHERTRAAGTPRFEENGQLVSAGSPAAARRRAPARTWAAAFLRRPAVALVGAAAIVLLVLALRPHRAPEVPGPSAQPPGAGIPWLTTRDVSRQVREAGGAQPLAEFDEALRAYAAHDLPRAVELLAAARVPESVEAYRRVFLGSALALSGRQAEAARVLLGAVEPELRDPLRLEAYQTLYAALSRSGRQASADSLLHALENHPSQLGAWARGMLKPVAPQ